MSIRSVVNTSPSDVGPGDTFIIVLKVVVTYTGYRIYRCPWPTPAWEEDLPQGDRMCLDTNEAKEVTDALFPHLFSFHSPDPH